MGISNDVTITLTKIHSFWNLYFFLIFYLLTDYSKIKKNLIIKILFRSLFIFIDWAWRIKIWYA